MVLGDENLSARWVTVDAGRDRDAVAKDVCVMSTRRVSNTTTWKADSF